MPEEGGAEGAPSFTLPKGAEADAWLRSLFCFPGVRRVRFRTRFFMRVCREAADDGSRIDRRKEE